MLNTMRETTSTTWKKWAEIKTRARTPKGIYRAIAREVDPVPFEPDEIEQCIRDGWITICSDGIIIWYDGY